MKKARKMVLSRETLRRLEARDMAPVAGGISNACTETSRASCQAASCGCKTGTAANSVVECISVYAY